MTRLGSRMTPDPQLLQPLERILDGAKERPPLLDRRHVIMTPDPQLLQPLERILDGAKERPPLLDRRHVIEPFPLERRAEGLHRAHGQRMPRERDVCRKAGRVTCGKNETLLKPNPISPICRTPLFPRSQNLIRFFLRNGRKRGRKEREGEKGGREGGGVKTPPRAVRTDLFHL